MATAQVKQLHAATGRKVVVVDQRGRPQWHAVFEGNPRIARVPERGAQRLMNCSGRRPYIAAKGPQHWEWRKWPISPGELYLSAEERAFASGHSGAVLIEPHTKVVGSNKAWIWERWQALVDCGGEFIQVGPAGTQLLRGVRFVETPSFRHACAVLAVSRAFVGTEGGLHHAAAALGVPAVVLFSEFISPKFTGYSMHRNLRHAGPACGSRIPCEGCRTSMEAITVEEVSSNLQEIIG
jgi:ADP-heptose:LPS heptosyltransferase